MPRSRLPRLSSIKDGSFEPSRRNPILLRNDEGLDTELKPLELGGKTTTLELSDSSAKFTGDLFVDKIRGGLSQSGGDFVTDGSINLITGQKLHFQSDLNNSFGGLTTGNTYIYADSSDIMYFYVGGEKLLTIGQAGGFLSQDKITTFTSSLSIDEGQKLYFEGMDSDSYLHRTTGDVFEFYGDGTKLLGITDSGNIILLNDEYIKNNTDGQIDLVSSDDNIIFSTSESGTWAGYGKKLYLDELGGSEYIYGYSSGGTDYLELYAGGVKMLVIAESGAAPHISLQPTHKLFFDSSVHTYIHEVSADKLEIVVGQDEMLTLDEANQRITLEASKLSYHIAGGTEYSATDSAYAGMILGYTCIGADVADDSHTLSALYVCFQDSGGTEISVTFKTPPSEYVEIEAELYFSAGSSSKQLRLSLSNNSSYGSNTLAHPDQFEKVVSTPARGNGGTFTQKWFLGDGNLAAIGSSNTLYMAASTDSTTGTPIIRWGGNASNEYTNLVMKATALPATIVEGS